MYLKYCSWYEGVTISPWLFDKNKNCFGILDPISIQPNRSENRLLRHSKVTRSMCRAAKAARHLLRGICCASHLHTLTERHSLRDTCCAAFAVRHLLRGIRCATLAALCAELHFLRDTRITSTRHTARMKRPCNWKKGVWLTIEETGATDNWNNWSNSYPAQ